MSNERGRGGEGSLRERCRQVLEDAWDEYRGYCYPHRDVYPHQWLWDSCFHSIAWAAVADGRARRELHGVFTGQLANGFVPHMRYAAQEMFRGPLPNASSYTQPPIYGHAAAVSSSAGFAPGRALLAHIEEALDYLWIHRRGDEGLVYIVHPWEAGADDSPRWDSWVGSTEWDRPQWTAFDLTLVPKTRWGEHGEAIWNEAFVAAPAAFNALVVLAFDEVAALTDEDRHRQHGDALSGLIDEHLWHEEEGLWSDRAIVGGGDSVHVPTLDGVLPALSTRDRELAGRALDQLADPLRFAAPHGLTYVARSHDSYRPDQYWRGASWPQLNYLAWVAARKWHLDALANEIAARATTGTLESGFSEYWNAETGKAYGAVPQTWAAIAAAYQAAAG